MPFSPVRVLRSASADDLALGVLVDPPVVDQPDRDGVEEVELLPARPARDDEPGVLEHAQVLHDPEAGHLQLGLELGERAAVALEEPVEEKAPGRVGERLEDQVVVGHRDEIGDQELHVNCENAGVTLHLSEADVAELLTPAGAVEAVEACFRRMAAGAVENRPRYRLRLEHGALAVMAASDLELGYAGAKVYAGFREGGARFAVLLFRADRPELVAVIDADKLGQLRTGAASGVAARHLARTGATSLGVIGCGWQAESQVECIRAALPGVERTVAYCRTESRLRSSASGSAASPARAIATPPSATSSSRSRLPRPGAARRVAAAGSARLRRRRERRPPARARQRRARAGGLRLLRLGRRREARVRRPDRADRRRRARLARGARAPGGRRRPAGRPRVGRGRGRLQVERPRRMGRRRRGGRGRAARERGAGREL